MPPSVTTLSKRDHEDTADPPQTKKQKQKQKLDATAKTFQCVPCDKWSTTKRALLRHERQGEAHRVEGVTEMYTCVVCSKQFPRLEATKRHVAEQHDGHKRQRTGRGRKPRDSFGSGIGTMSSSSQDSLPDGSDVQDEEDARASYSALHASNRGLCSGACFLRAGLSDEALHTLELSDEAHEEIAEIHRKNPRYATREIKCSICHLPFARGEHHALFRRLNKHFRDLSSSYTCERCEVAFVHESDLNRHLESSREGHCGFNFIHINECTGHHKPIPQIDGLTVDDDRFNFCYRIRSWEQAQLETYRGTLQLLVNERADQSSPCHLTIQDPWDLHLPNRRCKSEPGDCHKFQMVEVGTSLTYCSIAVLANDIRSIESLSFTRAVSSGDLQLVESLLEAEYSSDYEDVNGFTALHYAVKFQFREIVDVLLQRGASPNVQDRLGRSPLAMAVRLHNNGIAEALLDAGADVESRDGEGNTCLHVSSSFLDVTSTGLLIGHGADPNATNNENQAPLHWAAENGSTENVKILVQHGASIVRGVLCSAFRGGSVQAANFLLASGANVSEDDLIPAVRCCYDIDPSFVARLRHAGASIDGETGLRTLEAACRTDNIPVIEYLLGQGVPLRESHLYAAVSGDCQDTVKLLLSLGISPDVMMPLEGCYQVSVISHAISNENFRVVNLLLDYGAKATADDIVNLFLTVSFNDGYHTLLSRLINAGADLKGFTEAIPLESAFESGDLGFFNYLIGKGACPNASSLSVALHGRHMRISAALDFSKIKPDQSNSAELDTSSVLSLHDAVSSMVQCFVLHGADINNLNIDFSPLAMVIAERSLEIASILVKNGADVNQKMRFQLSRLRKLVWWKHWSCYTPSEGDYYQDHSPLSIARAVGNEDITDLLIFAGAKEDPD